MPLRAKQFVLLVAALLAASFPGVYWALQAGDLVSQLKRSSDEQQSMQVRSYLLAIRSGWAALDEPSARRTDAPSELLNRAWSVINANRSDSKTSQGGERNETELIYRELYIVRPESAAKTVPTQAVPPSEDDGPPAEVATSPPGPSFDLTDILQLNTRQRTAVQHTLTVDSHGNSLPVLVWQMGPQEDEASGEAAGKDEQQARAAAEYARQDTTREGAAATESRALMKVELHAAARDETASPLGEGWLIAEYDRLSPPINEDAVMFPAVLTVFLSLAVAGLLGIVLQRVVVQPVQSLSGAMMDVAQKADYTLRVPVTRKDELGQLQRGFNRMITQVDQLTAGLEALVHERTKELDRANRELQRSNTDLDRFAYTVSHDLQAPLRNVTLIVQQLREDWAGKVPEEVLKRIEEIDQQCDREMKMVQRILFISRLGRGEFQQQPVDLQATVDQILSGMRASLQERGIIVEVPSLLPTVAGDGILLGEVLRNLVSNAAKYNDKPEKRIRIVARVFPTHGTTVFAVQDNGIGIRPQHLKKVFDLFTPLHDKRKFAETIGAGMAITRRIVERHRGKIRVVSVFGKGTSFFVRLPTEGIARTEPSTTESIRMGTISLRALSSSPISR